MEFKEVTARYADDCSRCKSHFDKGTKIYFEPSKKLKYCEKCYLEISSKNSNNNDIKDMIESYQNAIVEMLGDIGTRLKFIEGTVSKLSANQDKKEPNKK